MSEPTNPLFEQEKAFLERKKLEYERALRGDVAQLKEQTAHAGRVAMVGAGLAGSLWLITKAFGGGKRRKKNDRSSDTEAFDYGTQHFADYDYDDDQAGRRDQDSTYWPDPDPYFGSSDEEAYGTVYHSETDNYDSPSASGDDLDDNDLHDYPDFPAHSAPHHGADVEAKAEPFQSEAYGHPESTLPFDDSRWLPESDEFAEPVESSAAIDQHPTHDFSAVPKRSFSSALVAFAKSDLGKVVVGQAASLAIALVTKTIKDRLPSDAPETPKSSDLADLTGKNDGYAHGHPATPQPDAYHAPADAPTYREPLA